MSTLHALESQISNRMTCVFCVCLIWIFMSWSLKLCNDPCFSWRDIQLLVVMYIWYYTLNYSKFLTKNFDFFGTPSWKCFYIFSARYLSLKERKRICAFLWKNEPRRTSAMHMIWWHSANRDVCMYVYLYIHLSLAMIHHR